MIEVRLELELLTKLGACCWLLVREYLLDLLDSLLLDKLADCCPAVEFLEFDGYLIWTELKPKV